MKVFIIGSGAYSLALSDILIKNNEVTLWTKFEEEKNELIYERTNKKVLNNIKINDNIKITSDISEAEYYDYIIICIPVPFIEETLLQFSDYIKNKPILIASKGIENKSNMFVSEILNKITNNKNIGVIAGGTFAIDIFDKKDIGLTIAGNKEFRNLSKELFNSNYVKLDETDDILATELLSSIKNVYAIYFGYLEGTGENISTKSYYFTEIVKDINNILNKLNLDKNIIYNYAGIGDLYLTCSSDKSRNFTFGKILASNNQEEIKNYLESTTVEGVKTLKSIYQILKNNNINSNIINNLYKKIYN